MSIEALRDQRLLVVGGAGFVGSNLIRKALQYGCGDVLVIDNLLSAERENIPNDSRVQSIEGSIAADKVLGQLSDEFDYVFHLATFHGNQNSIADPLADHENNLVTTLKLLEHVRDFKRMKKFVYSASGCVLAPHTFDSPEPVHEDGPVPLELDSPYQISKVVGEFHTVYYYQHHHVPTVRARFQNVYGGGEILGAGKWRGTPATVWRNVVPTFVYRALKGQPLLLDNGGTASRDFIYVEDIVEGLLLCATVGRAGGVYNLATGAETTILDLATTINRETGNPGGITMMPARAWDRAGRRLGSVDKAQRDLGFEARTNLESGLAKTIEWTRQNISLIDACIHRHASMLAVSDQ